MLKLETVSLELVNRTNIPSTFTFSVDRSKDMHLVSLPHELRRVQKYLGGMGYRPRNIPCGGFRFPYDAEESFDWSLLGSERLVMRSDTGEDEIVVRFGGDYFKRRVLPVNPKKNMPPAIRYSRGARSSDQADLADGEEIKYITLAVFRGNGPTEGLLVNG